MLLFFFFKKKTGYEMATGDWSSDVCSSDLAERSQGQQQQHGQAKHHARLLGVSPVHQILHCEGGEGRRRRDRRGRDGWRERCVWRKDEERQIVCVCVRKVK